MPIMIDLKSIAPVAIGVLVFYLVYLHKRRSRPIGYLVCLALFCIYLMYTVKYTLFPLRLFDPAYAQVMRQDRSWVSGINAIPFRHRASLTQEINNILLMVPFGFGMPFLRAPFLQPTLWSGFLYSLAIELSQFVLNLSLGYAHRVVDVDDLFLNVVGVLVGFALFRIFARVYRTTQPVKHPYPRFWEHMHAVLMRL